MPEEKAAPKKKPQTESNILPLVFTQWFKNKGWELRDYQRKILEQSIKQTAGRKRKTYNTTLLIAPTGAGKTLSGFLPSLVELAQSPQQGLHTLYISPLKALTQDIHRNLLQPIEEMDLPITAETRTGDTPSHKRQRQRKKPPNLLLTTPESLMLMLSYADADKLFGKLKRVIIDETHSLVANKRGDFLSLALARLSVLSPEMKRVVGHGSLPRNARCMASWHRRHR